MVIKMFSLLIVDKLMGEEIITIIFLTSFVCCTVCGRVVLVSSLDSFGWASYFIIELA